MYHLCTALLVDRGDRKGNEGQGLGDTGGARARRGEADEVGRGEGGAEMPATGQACGPDSLSHLLELEPSSVWPVCLAGKCASDKHGSTVMGKP